MNDGELVAGAREGDLACLEALWTRHRPRVVAIARRMLGDEDAAAEVAQDVALVALTDLGRLRRPELVGAWLAGIARNLCRRRLRGWARPEWSWEAVQGGRLPQQWPDTDLGPDEVAVRAEVTATIRRAVARLPDGQRDAVQLFYLEDRTHREVAEALGIDVNAVKARLHRARRSLRPLVAPQAPTRPMRTPDREETPMVDTDRISMEVRDVRRRTVEGDEQHVVLLEQPDGPDLAIWIGMFEAIALALRLAGVTTPRPFTYDTVAELVAAAGGQIREVAITRLEEGTYFAEAAVHSNDGVTLVDLRPSDALNIALTTDAKIVATREVLQAAQAAAESHRHPDDFDSAFPDDATTIATEIQQQWARHLEHLDPAEQGD